MIIKQIVIHHTASSRDNTTLASVDAWHKARDFTFSSLGYYVGYHYLILGTGEVIQTRRDNEIGCHSIPNDGKLGICLTGNFETETPSEAQLKSLKELLDKKLKEYNLDNWAIKGHRELSNTACPGKNLLIWVLQNRISWLRYLINKFLSGRS